MSTADTIEQQVTELISKATRDEAGKLVLPEAEPALLYAARAEIRRRDTQAEFTRAQQKLKQAEHFSEKLTQELETAIVSSTSTQEQARLAELKHSNPDAWLEEMRKLEDSAKGKAKERIQQVKNTSDASTEIERRAIALDAFHQANPGIEITDEVIQNDVPPRLTKQLADGKITFEDFLVSVAKIVKGDIKINKGEQAPNLPDLSKVAGGDSADSANAAKQSDNDYVKEVY
jgi:hypothetical protein